MRLPLRAIALLSLLSGVGSTALAQLDRAPQPIDIEPTTAYDEEAPFEEEDVPDSEDLELLQDPAPLPEPERRVAPPTVPAAAPATVPAAVPATAPAAPERATPAATVVPAAATEPAAAPAGRTPPKPILLPSATDADLLAAWDRWRTATRDLDTKAADAAQAELIRLKQDLGIDSLDTFGVALARAAGLRQKANDAPGAVALATAAVQLAPDLPSVHLALAQASFGADPTAASAYLGPLKDAVTAVFRDPRYRRPALADLGAALIFALIATAVTVSLVLFVRRARYFFHDFHHLFPRSAARWQSAAIALLLVTLPFVFRVGVAPVVLTLLAAVALYLSTSERLVAAVAVGLLGVLPVLAGAVVERTAFAGTAAEDVQQLERGGLPAAEVAARIDARSATGDAAFAELFALGRYELRRGKLDAAIGRFKAAAAQRTNDARLLTNLGNAMMAQGDPDGASEMFKAAAQADPTLAAPLYNLSRLYNRRAAIVSDELVGAELDKAQTAISSAQQLDASLLYRRDPPDDNLLHNRLLISPPLPREEIEALSGTSDRGDRVTAQLSQALVGTSAQPLAAIYPAAAALLVLLFGFAAERFGASRGCEKCGRSVCRRCDRELGVGSQMCAQCVNVYARKGVVPPPVKVRKQIEVDRYRSRTDKISYLFGLVCSGAGHLFSGVPVRGALYVFSFLFLVFLAVFRFGVLRAPFAAMPVYLKLAPVGLAFLLLYLLTLRGLYKRQTG